MIKQLRFVFAAGMVAGLFGASGTASATQCAQAVNIYNTSCTGTPAQIAACQAQIMSYHPECFSAGANTAMGAKSIQATSLEQMLAVSSTVSNRFTLSSPGAVADSGERKGLAAGNAGGKWNVWASVAEASAKYDRGVFDDNSGNGPRTNRFDNRIDNLVIGGDYLLAPNLALGLSAAFDSGRGSATSYQIATPDGAKSVSTSGYTYAPYLGWQINKEWALDATVGWGKGKSTVTSTSIVTDDSKRFFYGTNLSYVNWLGNWQLTGKGSYLFGQEKNDNGKSDGVTIASTNVTNEVGQFRLAGQAAYWMNGVMPYFGLTYVSDDRSTTASAAQQNATAMGKDAWTWSLGANFISIKNAVTGGIGYEQETGRDRSKNSKLLANINFRF